MSTYREYIGQIEDLRVKAAAARRQETQAAIREIRRLIAEFDLTGDELGLPKAAAGRSPTATSPKRVAHDPAVGRRASSGTRATAQAQRKSVLAGRKVAPKYKGPNGELWSGRGRKPAWVVDALTRGQSMAELAIAG